MYSLAKGFFSEGPLLRTGHYCLLLRGSPILVVEMGPEMCPLLKSSFLGRSLSHFCLLLRDCPILWLKCVLYQEVPFSEGPLSDSQGFQTGVVVSHLYLVSRLEQGVVCELVDPPTHFPHPTCFWWWMRAILQLKRVDQRSKRKIYFCADLSCSVDVVEVSSGLRRGSGVAYVPVICLNCDPVVGHPIWSSEQDGPFLLSGFSLIAAHCSTGAYPTRSF